VEITQVRVFPVDEEKLRAFVSIIIDECFVVSDIKIIQGTSGLFISMPSKKRKNGTFRDIAHPLNNETRRRLEEIIIASYKETVAEHGGDDSTPLRSLSEADDDDGATTESAGNDVAAVDDSQAKGSPFESVRGTETGDPHWP
jgi:stage V sporulation protein G